MSRSCSRLRTCPMLPALEANILKPSYLRWAPFLFGKGGFDRALQPTMNTEVAILCGHLNGFLQLRRHSFQLAEVSRAHRTAPAAEVLNFGVYMRARCRLHVADDVETIAEDP